MPPPSELDISLYLIVLRARIEVGQQGPGFGQHDRFDVSPSAISQHLKVLREAKLVLMEKRAQQRLYRINPQAMLEVEDWARQMTRLWQQRFDALEAVLKEEKLRKKGSNKLAEKPEVHLSSVS
jgi:DNA-binding transcriptional ArsR family regulator